MFLAVVPILAVEDNEISYVVGENGSLVAGSIFQVAPRQFYQFALTPERGSRRIPAVVGSRQG